MDSAMAREEIISPSSLETHSQALKNFELKKIFIDSPRALKRFGELIQKCASCCGLHDENVKGLRNMQEIKDINEIISVWRVPEPGDRALIPSICLSVCLDMDSALHTRKMSVFIRTYVKRNENCSCKKPLPTKIKKILK